MRALAVVFVSVLALIGVGAARADTTTAASGIVVFVEDPVSMRVDAGTVVVHQESDIATWSVTASFGDGAQLLSFADAGAGDHVAPLPEGDGPVALTLTR